VPLISVVVPTHNRPEMLAEALASVRAQTFTDYEIIVVSNGENAEMRHRSHVASTRAAARYFALSEGNVSAARNFAIDQAKGEWVAFLDDDDIWLPEKLERQIEAARRSGADMVVCGCIEFDTDGHESLCRQRRIPAGWTHHKALCHGRWMALPSAVILRKSAIQAAGGFNPEIRIFEDGDLWRRISWNHSIHEIGDPLTKYRKHVGSVSQNQRKTLRNTLKVMRRSERWSDTPPELRSDIPHIGTFVYRGVVHYITPWWLRHPRKLWRRILQVRS
jgi:glycosyltransferase involved in cell wall biosynthesis